MEASNRFVCQKMTKMYEYGDFGAECLRNWRIFCTFAGAKVDGCREEKAYGY